MTEPEAQVRLVVIGATGRVGAALLRLLPEFPSLRLTAAVCRPGSPFEGRDSGLAAGLAANGVPLTGHLAATIEDARLVLDFSTAAGAVDHVRQCAEGGAALLLGTTGLGPEAAAAVEAAAGRIPILVAPNTSLGASVLVELVRRAASVLGPGFDVSIQDLHHRTKRDAPSGTALALGTAIQEGSQIRPRTVDYSSIRGGDAAGQHDVRFLGAGESLHLSHRATDRGVFARGALRSGLWLALQAPGRYAMSDVAARLAAPVPREFPERPKEK